MSKDDVWKYFEEMSKKLKILGHDEDREPATSVGVFVLDKNFNDDLSNLVGRKNYKCKAEVICDHAETCTQRLVVCEHQKPHSVKDLLLNGGKLFCTTIGYCSVAELEAKCIKK